MAVDMFLEIDTIKGESTDSDFKTKNAMDLQSWSWGMSNAGSGHVGGGSGSGKANVNDLSFTKQVDQASTPLMLAVMQGSHFAKATLSQRKASGGKKPALFLAITMEHVFVTSYHTGAHGDGGSGMIESLSLNFSKFKVEYFAQKADGSKGATFPMSFDIKEQQV